MLKIKIHRPTNVIITQHGGGERIEDPADPQRVFAEGEPGEIVNGAPAGFLQRRQESNDGEGESGELANDREGGARPAPRIGETQNQERSRQRDGGDQPEIGDDPGSH